MTCENCDYSCSEGHSSGDDLFFCCNCINKTTPFKSEPCKTCQFRLNRDVDLNRWSQELFEKNAAILRLTDMNYELKQAADHDRMLCLAHHGGIAARRGE